MDIRVFSKHQLRNYLTDGHYDRLAVISFLNPDEKPMQLPDDIRKYYVQAYDNDRDALKLKGISYGKYLPEADELAEFIIVAYRDNYDIICECRNGQSMSAGCGAAIAEYFDKNGISIFSDYRFCPNQMVYNKVYNALKRADGRQPDKHHEAHIFSRRYYELFLQKCIAAKDNYADVLDFLSDAEDIVADTYGAESIFAADVIADRGLILKKSKQFDKAAEAFEKAEEIYLKEGAEHNANYTKEMLAKTFVKCGKVREAIAAANNMVSKNNEAAGWLLADIYSMTKDYQLALNELEKICVTAEAPRKKAKALQKIGRVYYDMGKKSKAAAYLSEAYKIYSEQFEKDLLCMNENFEMMV